LAPSAVVEAPKDNNGKIPCVLLLFLIGLMAVRSWRDLRLWLGVPILFTGAALLILGLLFLIATLGVLYIWIRDAAPAYASAIKAAGGLLGAIARTYGMVTEGEGFFLTILGLVLFLPALNARQKS
jgi:hypothetical protein